MPLTVASHATVTLALAVVPYVLCKTGVAVNTAAIEYLYGQLGGTTLEAEADTLHWEFLLMGTCMGGMRAVAIRVARHAQRKAHAAHADVDDGTPLNDAPLNGTTLDHDSGGCRRRAAEAGTLLARGITPSLDATTADAAGRVANAATVATTIYGVGAMALFVWTRELFFIAKGTPEAVREEAQRYGRGFAWGVLPTLWLYLNEQLLLGVHASGTAMLYGGIVYGALCTVFAAAWYREHGAYGMGAGMSAGAWIAWVLLKLHLYLDPRMRALGLNFELVWRSEHGLAEVRAIAAEAADYLKLAVPLAASNMVGLASGLIVAASVTEQSTIDAFAYSIAGAYYSTLSIAMLGASSATSAVLSMHDPRTAEADVLPRAGGPSTRRVFFITSGIVVALAVVLGALPLIFPEAFAVLFGGRVYAFGPAFVRSIMDRVKVFNYIAFAAYAVSMVGMTVSASLHGLKDVWVPLAINAGTSAVGIVWTVACTRRGDAAITIAWGSVLVAVLNVVAMLAWCLISRAPLLLPPRIVT